MLNIAIYVDNKYIRSIIEEIILDYIKINEIEIRVELFHSGEKLIKYLKKEDKSVIEVASNKRNKSDDYMSKIVLII
jgi:hypothetical protein